jgi:hypothetical protein
MRLDYSIPQFQLLAGGFDATDYLDAISLSVPHFEINQPLLWTGKFSLSYNRKAISRGLSEDYFNQLTNPGLWRPGQVQVVLRIKGHTLPILRIDRYAYNAQTQRGEGSVTQILGLLATDRPATEPDTRVDTRSITSTVERLLDKAFDGVTVAHSVAITGVGGEIFGGVTTRNPVSDAQQLCGINWQWLTVDNTEAIRTINGDPIYQPVVFSRTLGQVEWEPDLDNINFAAQKVIVTGSSQQPDPKSCPDAPNANLDKNGRPKTQRTEEQQPAGILFPSLVGDTTPTVSEVKWIFSQYLDDSSLPFEAAVFVPTSLLFDLQTVDKGTDKIQPFQTITVKEQPAGRIFSSLGTSTTLHVAKIEIQNNLWKASYVPNGTLFASAGADFNLVLEKREDLKTTPVDPNTNHGGTIDPATGAPTCLEPKPKAEPRQLVAEIPLKTVPSRGEALVSPTNWTPIHPQSYVVDVGFLPPALADGLARQIANREQRRRDSVQVTLPIPDEWLAAGCPLLVQCQIYDGTFQMDAPILVMENNGTAKLSFSAGRIDRLGVATFAESMSIDLEWTIEIEVTTELIAGGGSGDPPNVIDGTSDDELLTGTAGADIIFGNGGNDTMIGGGGNDTLVAGPGGNDILVSNILDGSNNVLRGVGEQDTLVGGAGAFNTFILGDAGGCYYLSTGDSYATITNFNADYDTIQLAGTSANYSLVNPAGGVGVAFLYHLDGLGGQDLVAKITTSVVLDLNGNFAYV